LIPPSDTRLFELRVASSSHLAGQTIRQAELPPDTLFVAVVRGGRSLFPNAETRLEEGDELSVLTSGAREREARAYLAREVTEGLSSHH